jgi:hypothetical protein
VETHPFRGGRKRSITIKYGVFGISKRGVKPVVGYLSGLQSINPLSSVPFGVHDTKVGRTSQRLQSLVVDIAAINIAARADVVQPIVSGHMPQGQAHML